MREKAASFGVQPKFEIKVGHPAEQIVRFAEEARHDGKPLTDAVLQHILELKLAARCIVTRGISGCYENGETATGNIEVLSYNMPIKIEVITIHPHPYSKVCLQDLDQDPAV